MGLVLAASLGLVGTPAMAAQGPAEGPEEGVAPATGPEEGAAGPEEGAVGREEGAASPAADEEGEPEQEFETTVEEVETGPAPSGGGVAGGIVDPNDPNAGRAQSDLEGESLDTDIEGLPERLPKLQAAAWWTTFGGVALGTAGGVLAGIAEARQDQADRLAYGFDLNTGRATLYGDVADEYEELLDQGVLYQNLARGFIIAGGATVIAGIVMFAVEGTRRRKAERASPRDEASGTASTDEPSARVEIEPSAGGLRLRF